MIVNFPRTVSPLHSRPGPVPAILSEKAKACCSNAAQQCYFNMSGVEEDESGGGVMIVFSPDPAKRSQVAETMRYTAQALRQHRLIVTEHDRLDKYGVPKSPADKRCVLVCVRIFDRICRLKGGEGNCPRLLELLIPSLLWRIRWPKSAGIPVHILVQPPLCHRLDSCMLSKTTFQPSSEGLTDERSPTQG